VTAALVPLDWTIERLAAALRARELSAVEVVDACLASIARLDARLRAFILVDADGARAAAKARDAEAAAGRARGPLHGVPLAYKDLCVVAGLPTSCGTKTPDYFRDDAECTAVARLTAAGAITLGKLNMTELATGPLGENAHHGHPQNPWRAGHCSGGSSSGSGVAVAAGLAFGALGSDTGGSIRLPSACCGIVGLKPTYGRVSRAGAMPLSWTNDHLGPMTRTVRDNALMLGVIAGHDPRDGTSSRRRVPDYLRDIERGVAGLRVGVPENYYFDVDAEVAAAVREAARRLGELGARVTTLRVPDPAPLTEATGAVSRAESSALHVRLYRERPGDLQPVVRARMRIGFEVSAYEYLQALRLRAVLVRQFVREVFGAVDVLVVPTIPEPAPALADVLADPVEEGVRRAGRFARLTRPFNGLGLPALSVPCGFAASGLPLAMQLVGRPFDEATVLRAGRAYERAAEWSTRRPPV
jgi:aspartyl-tRNA(Asn)/glutamyl-tRNA(Gln) amidotransferase subunit A